LALAAQMAFVNGLQEIQRDRMKVANGQTDGRSLSQTAMKDVHHLGSGKLFLYDTRPGSLFEAGVRMKRAGLDPEVAQILWPAASDLMEMEEARLLKDRLSKGLGKIPKPPRKVGTGEQVDPLIELINGAVPTRADGRSPHGKRKGKERARDKIQRRKLRDVMRSREAGREGGAEEEELDSDSIESGDRETDPNRGSLRDSKVVKQGGIAGIIESSWPDRWLMSEAEKFLKGSMHWVVVDVPCSGSGTYRRSPDSKWRFSLEALNALVKLQRQIFAEALKFLRPDGRMVYITCSVLREENEDQLEYFMRTHDLEVDEGYPCRPGGFFVDLAEREQERSAGGAESQSAGGEDAFANEQPSMPKPVPLILRLMPTEEGPDGFFGVVLKRREPAK